MSSRALKQFVKKAAQLQASSSRSARPCTVSSTTPFKTPNRMAQLSTCPVSRASATTATPKEVHASIQTLENPARAVPEKYRHQKLNAAQRELIKASLPALQAHGFDITKTFYGNMLESHSELKDIFNNANQKHYEQPRALAEALLAYATHIDDLSPLGPAVELMAAKHASLYVQPEQYAIVGEHLIAALGKVLGDAVTPELAEAWTAAYWQLAEILINRENQLYKASGNWTDWADFKIARKVKESDEVTSFYLEPVDPTLKPLPSFLPGQFISIQIDVAALGHRQARQYSLSQSPNADYFRISVKRETGSNAVCPMAQPGLISNLMHDTKNEGDIIRVSHPYGDFFLDLESGDNSPLVLVSGGIGVTPLLSILNTLVSQNVERPVSWIQGARSAHVRAFTEHIKSLAAPRQNLQVRLYEDQPEQDEVEGKDYDVKGFIDLKDLDYERTLFLNNPQTQYFVCGPVQFMSIMESSLLQLGVDQSKIRMERFGTGGLARAA